MSEPAMPKMKEKTKSPANAPSPRAAVRSMPHKAQTTAATPVSNVTAARLTAKKRIILFITVL